MKINIHNKVASLTINSFGGAITNFSLMNIDVNPLSFIFSSEQMPLNNKPEAPFQGHFLCLGRWGEPSLGEIRAGIPYHGEFVNLNWKTRRKSDNLSLDMSAESQMEGLKIFREIKLDKNYSIFSVKETINNINPIGRLYNMVQHPTVSYPFLDNTTIVDCNGGMGFNQKFFENSDEFTSRWPYGVCSNLTHINLRNPKNIDSSLFSFVVENGAHFGWLTCYCPKYKLLLGYIWNRKDYPWIHLWQDCKNGKLESRGIEFGTAGIHKPFEKILQTSICRFNENTMAYIDAGEYICRSYSSFLYTVGNNFKGVKGVKIDHDKIYIEFTDEKSEVCINSG